MTNPQQLSAEQILENFNKFRSLCEQTGERASAAVKMVDSLGEALIMCPASSKLSFHNCMPGGLVEHSLRVLRNALTLCKSFNWELSKESLILGSLFHDLGKVGTVDSDGNVIPYYIPQDSDWHRDRLGEMYKHNPDIAYMTVPQRGVWLCQHYGLQLSHDEYLAIILNDGWVLQENKPYCLKEPLLAHVVMTADYISTYQEKIAFQTLTP